MALDQIQELRQGAAQVFYLAIPTLDAVIEEIHHGNANFAAATSAARLNDAIAPQGASEGVDT